MIIEIITSELDFYLIERVRELRLKSNLSQVALAQRLGVSEGYIGKIENWKQPGKYNVRMLARIAIALDLNSYMDLFPSKSLSNDLIKIRINLFDSGNTSKSMKVAGDGAKRFEILSRIPLTEDEIIEYDRKILKK